MGGGSYDRRTAIHSAKEVKMRRVGSRGMDIILVGRKSVKKGVFQFIKAQKKWGRKEKAKGGQRAGVAGEAEGRRKLRLPCLWEVQGTSVTFKALQGGSK